MYLRRKKRKNNADDWHICVYPLSESTVLTATVLNIRRAQ